MGESHTRQGDPRQLPPRQPFHRPHPMRPIHCRLRWLAPEGARLSLVAPEGALVTLAGWGSTADMARPAHGHASW